MTETIHLQVDDGYPSGFTMMDNRDIWTACNRDRRLVMRPAALGIYAAMRSMPRDWNFRESWLIEHLGIGRDALRRVIRELEDSGRLTRSVERDEQGRYVRTIWRLHRGGNPMTAFPSLGSPSADEPSSGLPAAEKSIGGKPRRRRITPRLSTEGAVSIETAPTRPRELVAPDVLSAASQQLVVEWMKGLPHETKQLVLDEFSGRMTCLDPKLEPIHKPMSWLEGTIQNAHRGEFVPDVALKVADDRRRREAILEATAQRSNAASLAAARLRDPSSREKAMSALTEIAQMLAIQSRAHEPSNTPSPP